MFHTYINNLMSMQTDLRVEMGYGGANDFRSASSVQSSNCKNVAVPISSTVDVRSIQAGWRERVNTEISAET